MEDSSEQATFLSTAYDFYRDQYSKPNIRWTNLYKHTNMVGVTMCATICLDVIQSIRQAYLSVWSWLHAHCSRPSSLVGTVMILSPHLFVISPPFLYLCTLVLICYTICLPLLHSHYKSVDQHTHRLLYQSSYYTVNVTAEQGEPNWLIYKQWETRIRKEGIMGTHIICDILNRTIQQ